MKRTVYDADQESFRTVIRDFIAKEVSPHFESWMEHGTPRELFNKLGDLGVMGFDLPTQYGGPGPTSFKYQAVVLEEAARAGVDLGHYQVTTSIVLPYLQHLANEEQRQRWFPGIATGDITLSIAMTEPGTGSDLAGIRTSARLSEDGTHYLLNGAKTFITGVRNAELCIVVARTAPAGGNRRDGLTLLAVDTSSGGFEIGRKLKKIGQNAVDTSEISFTDVVVPVENRLGEEGQGFAYLGQNLVRERLVIGVIAAASATAALDHARAYTRDRIIFGNPVSSFQNTKFVLAECAVEIEALQAMTDKALDLNENDELSAADAAKVKLYGTEVAGRVIDKCLQLHGGYGYMLEYPIARMYADTRVTRIYGGTSEVMKTIIAKDLGL